MTLDERHFACLHDLKFDVCVLRQVVHIFSHIHQTYIVFSVCVSDCSEKEQEQKTCWLTKSALEGAAVSTGLKKVGVFQVELKLLSLLYFICPVMISCIFNYTDYEAV